MSTRRGWQAGKAGYLLTTLNELRRFENCQIRLTIDDEVIDASVLFVAFANGAYYGGGMRIAPDARTDDGRLDICVVGDISRVTAIRQLPNLYRGSHVRHPAVTMHAGTKVSIDGADSDARPPRRRAVRHAAADGRPRGRSRARRRALAFVP